MKTCTANVPTCYWLIGNRVCCIPNSAYCTSCKEAEECDIPDYHEDIFITDLCKVTGCNHLNMGYDECRCHREIRKMNEKQMLDEAPTLKISNLQDWLDRLPDVPVFIEMDGCIAGATHLSIYHDHIVIGCPESGDV